MSGDWLAMGAIAALAAASAARRGSGNVEPVVLRHLSRAEVAQHWGALRRAGKHRGHPQEDFRWPYEEWVEVELPLDLVDEVTMYPGTMGWGRVQRYAVMPGPLPPGLALYSGRAARNDARKVYLVDGNHRANAARLRGESTLRVYMPALDWALFQRRGSGSVVPVITAEEQRKVTRSGFPWPYQTVLYHGTYAMGVIERQGFRTRQQGAVAMAGGGHVRSVSATLLPQRAAAIALGLDTLARVAQRNLSLPDLVYQLETELGVSERTGDPLMVDVLTAFADWVRSLAGPYKPYTVEAYHAIIGNLELIDKGWSFVSPGRKPKIGRPYVLPSGALEIEGRSNDYLVPPGSALPLTYDALMRRAMRQIPNPSDRGAWAWDRVQGYAYGRCDAAYSVYKAALDYGGGRAQRLFNPLLMDTDVEALARVPRSSIGVIELRSSVPRICTDEKGAVQLGYLRRSDRIRDDKMRSWSNDCQSVLDFPRDDEHTEKLRMGALFGLWDSYLRDKARWQGWSVEQQGARTPQTTMFYQPNEQEVRIYDTSQIEVVGHSSMAQIRRRFELGDRLTFPWFDAGTADVRVWPVSAGSKNVETQAGYHRTAVAKTGPSVPLRHLLTHHPEWVKGKVLDFGTGRGRDCKALGKRKGVTVACYDPHHPEAKTRELPTGTFDLVIANYVVNVLPKTQRRKTVKQMASKVKKGGILMLAARSCADRQGVQSARGWTAQGDGYAQFAEDGALSRFQRFYASGALEAEARDILGRSFSPLKINASVPSGTALVAFRRSR